MTAEQVLDSEEAYFLKRINGRNNARILKMVANALQLRIPTVTVTVTVTVYLF